MRSKEHFVEVHERLLNDPIILELAQRVHLQDIWPSPSWPFVMACLSEYEARGGRNHIGIVGPAKAIQELVLQREGCKSEGCDSRQGLQLCEGHGTLCVNHRAACPCVLCSRGEQVDDDVETEKARAGDFR